MRILVTGGRNYSDHSAVAIALSLYRSEEDVIIHGGAKTGLDYLVDEWCNTFRVRKLVFRANWTDLSHPGARIKKHSNGSKYDAEAGPRRNTRMIEEGRPDFAIIFPGRRGTKDCLEKIKAAGIDHVFAGGAPDIGRHQPRLL